MAIIHSQQRLRRDGQGFTRMLDLMLRGRNNAIL